MDKDGTKDGYDIELTRAISESIRIPVIASGGAGTLEHLYQAVTDGAADAVWQPQFSITESTALLRPSGI